MNAGLPGTGIGGLFYVLSAFFMPLHRGLRGALHSGRTWRRVLAQLSIAVGILGALFVTGWGLAFLLTPAVVHAHAGTNGTGAVMPVQSVVRWMLVVGTAGILAALLVIVEILRLVLRRRPTPALPALDPPLFEKELVA